jgi:hypothetical protein
MKFTRQQKIIGLAGLLVVQVIIILFLNIFSSTRINTRSLSKPLVSGFSGDAVLAMEVTDYLDTFSIERREGTWFVNIDGTLIPGNVEKITSYLELLEELPRGQVVLSNADSTSDGDFGFDQKNSQVLKVTTSNRKDFTVKVGNPGSRRGTSYIIFNDDRKIREVESFIATETSNEPVQWAKRSIFDQLTVEDIEKYSITSSLDWFKGAYSVIYKEQEEADKEDFILDPPMAGEAALKDFVLRNMVQALINVQIDEYKLNGNVDGRKPIATLELLLKNTKTYMIDIYESDPDDISDYILSVGFNNYLYLIDEDGLKRFIKSRDELKK